MLTTWYKLVPVNILRSMLNGVPPGHSLSLSLPSIICLLEYLLVKAMCTPGYLLVRASPCPHLPQYSYWGTYCMSTPSKVCLPDYPLVRATSKPPVVCLPGQSYIHTLHIMLTRVLSGTTLCSHLPWYAYWGTFC